MYDPATVKTVIADVKAEVSFFGKLSKKLDLVLENSLKK